MSFSQWLKGIFNSQGSEENDEDKAIPDMEYDDPFIFSQHLRIVLAIVVTLLSAAVIWWILA